MPRNKKKTKGKANKISDSTVLDNAAKTLKIFSLDDDQFPDLGAGPRRKQPPKKNPPEQLPTFRPTKPSDLSPAKVASTTSNIPEALNTSNQKKPSIPPNLPISPFFQPSEISPSNLSMLSFLQPTQISLTVPPFSLIQPNTASTPVPTIQPGAASTPVPTIQPNTVSTPVPTNAMIANPTIATNPTIPTNPAMPPNPTILANSTMPPNPTMLANPAIPANPTIPTNPVMQPKSAMPSNPRSSPSRKQVLLKTGSTIASEGKTEYKIPTRGGPGMEGKEGRLIKVHANHFPINFKASKPVNHYDLSFSHPWKKELRKSDEPLLRRVFAHLEKAKVIPPLCAFDGMKNMFTRWLLKAWSGKVTVKEIDRDRDVTIEVDLKLVRSNIDLKKAFEDYCSRGTSGNIPMSEIQIMDIVLGQVAKEKCVTIGRNFFPDSSIAGRPVELPRGKTCWFGFFQSVRLGWKPMLNVDVANKPAVKAGPIIQYMEEFLERPGRGRNFPAERPDFQKDQGRVWNKVEQRDLMKLEKDLKGLKIRYNRPDGQKRVWSFHKIMDTAANLKMEHDGQNMTVAEYFELVYKYKLKYPYLPCLHLGSPQKTIFIPAELCEMKCQALPRIKQLDEEQAALMIRQTAVTPAERKKKIENQLKEISNVFGDDKFAKDFGLSVEGVMCQIPARVYDPPRLAYCDLQKEKNGEYEKIEFRVTQPGKWDMTRGPKGSKPTFIDSKPLDNWAILDLANTHLGDINAFVDALYAEGDKIGYRVEYSKKTESENPYYLDRVVTKFVNLCNIKPKLDMILVITKGRNNNIYNGLKYEGDVVNKISTQFVLQKNIGNQRYPAKPSTLHNILLKVNSKLGGTNQTLHSSNRPGILHKPVMIMGADVTHASPEFKGVKPSIAAVVGSMDPNASVYNCEVRLQNTGQNEEMIESMEDVTKKLLLKFHQNTNRKPERIIFYRDGVSEGQFLKVLNIELAAIRRACFSLEQDWEPPITYIVAQKRHKTRLFPVNPKEGVGKSGNVPAGTVVDQVIVHPSEFSFFLASHEGIQGTSKPTYYHVLWDDAIMKSDDIIKMTYYLCHTYARCERSVSYPAPTYYAHLAAFRARVHHDALIDKGEDNRDNKRKLEEVISLANYFM